MSCRNQQTQAPAQPLPEKPQPGPQALSSYTPADPYTEFASNLLLRKAYTVDDAGMAIEIWDLMVGPGKKSSNARLPGAAVLEVRSGQAAITVAGQAREVRMGTTFSLDEGAEFSIENRTPNDAVRIRATVIRRRRG
jgi:hypothetical protein